MRIYVPNITPDNETGIGSWTDDEIARSIRDGIRPDGRVLFPMMPYGAYQHMSDEDMKSIVVYLRSLPPVKQEAPRFENEMPGAFRFLIEKVGVTLHEPVTSVPEPDKSDPVAYGKYLTHLGHCGECHAATPRGPLPEDDPMYMAGTKDFSFSLVTGTVYPSNLTPDPTTGLGELSAEQIADLIRHGKRKDGSTIAPPMSLMVPMWAHMTDEDVGAIVAYLQSLPPQDNAVPERKLTDVGNDFLARVDTWREGYVAERESASAEAWAQAVTDATQKHIESITTDGLTTFEDDQTGDELKLKLKELHSEIKSLEDKGETACAIFLDPEDEAKVYDVDFWVTKGEDGAPKVDAHSVHKVPTKDGDAWTQEARYDFPKAEQVAEEGDGDKEGDEAKDDASEESEPAKTDGSEAE